MTGSWNISCLNSITMSCFFPRSWVLYESPGFQGRSIALEEGGIELTNVWAENGLETEAEHIPPMLIGSIRLAVSVRESAEIKPMPCMTFSTSWSPVVAPWNSAYKWYQNVDGVFRCFKNKIHVKRNQVLLVSLQRNDLGLLDHCS